MLSVFISYSKLANELESNKRNNTNVWPTYSIRTSSQLDKLFVPALLRQVWLIFFILIQKSKGIMLVNII